MRHSEIVPMNRRRRISALAALLVVLCTATACSAAMPSMVTGVGEPGLRLIAPSVAGGGYDLTARSLARGWAAEDVVVDDVLVLPGSGGVVGLNRLALEQGNDRLLLVMGLGLVGALSTTPSDHSITDVTPIARLVTEPEVVLVPAASPLRTFADLLDRWRSDTSGLQFAGGSAEGGPDGLFRTQLARAVGVDPRASEYRVYDGGGELLPALLTGQVDVATTGVSEYLDQIASGTVRVLAVSSAERIDGIDAPTVREQGVDLDFDNWRGILAPPGLPPDRVDALTAQVESLVESPVWQEILLRNGWRDALLTGDDFASFLDEQADLVRTTIGPPTTG
ncbi:Bug family tripartite tricarboxylate transporter substrate binding protein [Rhodococcus sp. MEB064]|uniref:Bug family tripartite tricarboxylate transporter substrate binding protein n=1 Tax=Rhodococcus sp. MEB064 TaxID=1587522 RepID=UPI001E2B860E|nr:tripartite tricarboxylate transporter substrate-binding protein [Rhodococcus sp. MEB064]